MFAARNRQRKRIFPERPKAEPEAAPEPEPAAVSYDENKSENIDVTPDIATFAAGGLVEAPKPVLVEPDADDRPSHPGPRGAEHMRPLTESEPVADEPKRGRGRPRPQETIDRDNAVHALLVGADADIGISKESIAAELDEKGQQVYSSLRQLTKEGRAGTRYVKPHGYRWFPL